jgi:hypothetical protein
MWLIIVYLVFMIIGDIADYVIGTAVERAWPAASLPTFLGLYFFFLWAFLDHRGADHRAENGAVKTH